MNCDVRLYWLSFTKVFQQNPHLKSAMFITHVNARISVLTKVLSQDLQVMYVSFTLMGINIDINKICHILFGNRRNIGYKYFSWNCGRGLLSKNKLDDVKNISQRHKPHFMGISEVDLRRNEMNKITKVALN